MASSQNTTLASLVVTGIVSMAGAVTLTGALTATSATLSGALSTTDVSVAPSGNGSGRVLVTGGGNTGSGGYLCLEDTDEAGNSVCNVLNGTMTCRVALAGECS